MLFLSSSSKLAIPLDSGFGVTDFARSPDFSSAPWVFWKTEHFADCVLDPAPGHSLS